MLSHSGRCCGLTGLTGQTSPPQDRNQKSEHAHPQQREGRGFRDSGITPTSGNVVTSHKDVVKFPRVMAMGPIVILLKFGHECRREIQSRNRIDERVQKDPGIRQPVPVVV